MKKILICLILLACPILANADTVRLKDGRSFQGDVVSDSDKFVKVREKVGEYGFAETSYRKADIDSIEKGPGSEKREADKKDVTAGLNTNTSVSADSEGKDLTTSSNQNNVDAVVSADSNAAASDSDKNYITATISAKTGTDTAISDKVARAKSQYDSSYKDYIDKVTGKINDLKSMWDANHSDYGNLKNWHKDFKSLTADFRKRYPIAEPVLNSRRKTDFIFKQFDHFDSLLASMEKTQKTVIAYEKDSNKNSIDTYKKILKNYETMVSRCIADAVGYCNEAKEELLKEEGKVSVKENPAVIIQ